MKSSGHVGVDQHGAGALSQDDGEECTAAGNGYSFSGTVIIWSLF